MLFSSAAETFPHLDNPGPNLLEVQAAKPFADCHGCCQVAAVRDGYIREASIFFSSSKERPAVFISNNGQVGPGQSIPGLAKNFGSSGSCRKTPAEPFPLPLARGEPAESLLLPAGKIEGRDFFSSLPLYLHFKALEVKQDACHAMLVLQHFANQGDGKIPGGDYAVLKGESHAVTVTMLKRCIWIENPEKTLAICNEKSSFKIDGCNIFVIINHMFLT